MALSLGDMESALVFFAEHADFEVHMPVDLLPHGGKFTGPGSFAKRLSNIKRDFDIAHFQGRTIYADGEGLRTQVDYALRHKKSGVTIDGVMRLLATVRSGQIVRWHEFHDTEKVNAYMRLVNSHKP